MKIDQATAATVTNLWSNIEARIGQAGCLEAAAQALAAALHSQFSESVVLARVYTTVALDALPTANQTFVRNLAESAGAASELKSSTPILSLLGTHGQEAAWNDRHNSQGHVGIPLISASFVDAIPMIARLLHELEVPVDWADSHDPAVLIETIGHSAGLFFVADAANAVDVQGRKIIVAEDFVASHGVKSVFGIGGAYRDTGQLFVFVLFCQDAFSRDTAELFLPLASLFQNKTASLVGANQIFAA